MRTTTDRLRRLADLSGIGRAPLSSLAGLGASTLTMSLRAREPSLRVLRAVASVTGTTLAWLVSGTGAAPRARSVTSAVLAAYIARGAT